MDKQQLKEREAKVIELAIAFCNEPWMKSAQSYVQNLSRNWVTSVPALYNQRGAWPVAATAVSSVKD
ncbi:MAG: hypothetical protein IKX25_11215 [Bacteroidales bacterium]|nr:hypothetical protein [Bacteroidales bacterium]